MYFMLCKCIFCLGAPACLNVFLFFQANKWWWFQKDNKEDRHTCFLFITADATLTKKNWRPKWMCFVTVWSLSNNSRNLEIFKYYFKNCFQSANSDSYLSITQHRLQRRRHIHVVQNRRAWRLWYHRLSVVRKRGRNLMRSTWPQQ